MWLYTPLWTVTTFRRLFDLVTFYQVLPVGDGGRRLEGEEGSGFASNSSGRDVCGIWAVVAPFRQLPQWQGHRANYLMLQPPPNLVAFNNNHRSGG